VSLPRIASHEEWLRARTDLLEKEKALTRARDDLNRQRRELPMVEVTKDHRFQGPDGEVTLLDIFEGRRQLILGHMMFDPEWDDGCPSCSAGVDEVSPGLQDHLHTRDTTLAYVSRAPLEKLQRWKERKGWDDIAWYSSYGSDFNLDFGVTIDPAAGATTYNFRTAEEWAERGEPMFRDADAPFEMPGLSCFLQDEGRVFRTYSQYARGAESTGGSYYFLDLTALGRQEDWEEPKGRADLERTNAPNFES
jgi:predicted dithiol-disulfide oxidoreductase (DUF899 family)